MEGVGTRAGLLTVTAPGFQTVQERLSEPPGLIHELALVPLAEMSLRVRVVTASGEGVSGAVVKAAPVNPLWPPQFAVTDADGVIAFSDAPPGGLRLTAFANGYVISTVLMPGDHRAAGATITLSPEL